LLKRRANKEIMNSREKKAKINVGLHKEVRLHKRHKELDRDNPEKKVDTILRRFFYVKNIISPNGDQFLVNPSTGEVKKKCVQKDCLSIAKTRGLCKKHNKEFLNNNKCMEAGCSSLILKSGYCKEHLIASGENKCSFDGCQSKKIRNWTNMLCSAHYIKEYRRNAVEKQNDTTFSHGEAGGFVFEIKNDDEATNKNQILSCVMKMQQSGED
jgi:hypothetical protein